MAAAWGQAWAEAWGGAWGTATAPSTPTVEGLGSSSGMGAWMPPSFGKAKPRTRPRVYRASGAGGGFVLGGAGRYSFVPGPATIEADRAQLIEDVGLTNYVEGLKGKIADLEHQSRGMRQHIAYLEKALEQERRRAIEAEDLALILNV